MLATVLPLAAGAAEEESSNFLVSPNVGLMIWTLLAFLVTLFILNKFAFPVIKEALDKRAQAIEDSISAAQKSKEESEALLAEYRERLKEARTQADDIVLRARKNAESFERDSQDQARQKREELLEQTGLQDVRHRLSGRLSHGFRKRLGLAQALVGDPPVLILDEPTAGLDPHQIVEIRELIRALRGHKTVLLSSHILTEVSQVCDRVLILDKGRLVCEESAGSLARYGANDKHAVSLTWDGDRDAVGAALASVVGVDEVHLTADGAEVLIGGNPIEVKPRLVESVLAAGGRLQRLEEHGPTLEDLFLRLTGGDRAREDH